MLNWLKWQIAGKELAELERWRAEWAEHDRWFAHYPAIALVLQRMKEVVDDEPVSSIRVLRDSLPEHHMFDELPAAPKPRAAHGEQFPGVSGFCVNGHGDAVTVFFDKVLTDAEVEAVKANMLAATPATPAQAEQKPVAEIERKYPGWRVKWLEHPKNLGDGAKLYTAPQPEQGSLTPLTDEQIDAATVHVELWHFRTRNAPFSSMIRDVARCAVAKFCELNGIGTSATKEG